MPDPQTARRRLGTQRLTGPGFADAPEAVRFLTAVQSQDYPAASWALGMRTAGSSAAAIDADYAAGRLLRTHVLRPTWHFVDPADLRWLLDLTAPRVRRAMASYYRQYGLGPEVLGRAEEVIAAALGGGIRSTRAELAERLAAAGIVVSGVPLTFVMMHAELGALICSGGLRGRQHTYTLVDERVPAAPGLDRYDALARLVHRYLVGHGPATVRDAAWWSGLTMTDVRRGIGGCGTDLVRLDRDGTEYWCAAAASGDPDGEVGEAGEAGDGSGVRLLPNFDEYLVGYAGHEEIYDAARFGPQEGYSLLGNVLLVDGEVRGFWRRVVRGRRVEVTLTPLEPLGRQQLRGVEAEVARYAEFLGLPVGLSVGAG